MKIFWRIFLTFWLSTSAIMLLTAYVVVHKIESHRVTAAHQAVAEKVALELIRLHESHRRLPRRLHRLMPPPDKANPTIPAPLKLMIVDAKQQEIYRSAAADKKFGPAIIFALAGDSGEQYTVTVNKPILPYILRYHYTRVFSMQLFLVLLVSALVSAVLSHFLIRPLKILGLYSKQFADREVSDVPASVLVRADEFGDLARDLSAMSNQITQLINNQQQLLHDVSHELRAPLARIQARIALLEQAGTPLTTTQALHHDCEKLNELIQRVLDYARLNRDVESLAVIDIGELIDDVIAQIHVEFPARQFNISVPPAATANVFVGALSGALENIIRNACLYTPENTAVDIALTEANHMWRLTVRDYGDGVAEHEREKLLEPFYRSGQRMHGEGFGLGLSIAHRALLKHNGELHLKRAEPHGLIVELLLPQKLSA